LDATPIETTPADQIPGAQHLWFVPLGGCGEIGMNMNLYGHNGQWLMVDCGIAFERATPAEGKAIAHTIAIAPDVRFIEHHQKRLVALVITHAHEDHLGAVARLWPKLRCPIYTTAFTAEILRRKLQEAGLLSEVIIHVLESDGSVSVGVFHLEWVLMTHSIPEPQGIVISTPAGKVFHTADWKLDANPVVGNPFNKARLQQLADEHIDAMVCDSTNATSPGRSISEGALYPGLFEAVAHAPGRVIATCFGSNIARMQTLATIATETGRYTGLLGRSLETMASAAKATGYWPATLTLSEPSHLAYLAPHEVLIIATGSQGDHGTALARLAQHRHPDIELEAGDTVIFSARTIPGNEQDVESLVSTLKSIGVKVIQAEDSPLPIHATGHPCHDELVDMYQWIKPALAIPVHGEARHMKANAQVALANGVDETMLGTNGDLFQIAPEVKKIQGFAPTGRIVLR